MSTLMFTDFDGTLYNPDAKLLLAWRYNSRTSKIIRRNNIKLIITTGRAVWNNFAEFQNKFFGMHGADIVVSGAGTYIYHRNENKKLVQDIEWNERMLKSQISIGQDSHIWTKSIVEDAVRPILKRYNLTIQKSPNPYQVVIPLYHMDVKRLTECMEKISMTIQKGIKVLITEKLYLFNSKDVFSGYMFVVPEIAGKAGSAEYIIEKESSKSDVLFFGDAMIDCAMLTLESRFIEKKYSYAVNATPLLQEKIRGCKDVASLRGNPPKLIYSVLKEKFSS